MNARPWKLRMLLPYRFVVPVALVLVFSMRSPSIGVLSVTT